MTDPIQPDLKIPILPLMDMSGYLVTVLEYQQRIRPNDKG